MRCQKPNGEVFIQGQNVTLREDAVPEAADVVFVIHQAACNREVVDQLKDLVDDMEKIFKAEGNLFLEMHSAWIRMMLL